MQYKREELSAIIAFAFTVVTTLFEIVAGVEVIAIVVVRSSVGFEELALIVEGIVGILLLEHY